MMKSLYCSLAVVILFVSGCTSSTSESSLNLTETRTDKFVESCYSLLKNSNLVISEETKATFPPRSNYMITRNGENTNLDKTAIGYRFSFSQLDKPNEEMTAIFMCGFLGDILIDADISIE